MLPERCSLGLSRGGLALRQNRCPWLPLPVVQHLQLLVILGKQADTGVIFCHLSSTGKQAGGGVAAPLVISQAGRSVIGCSTLWRQYHLHMSTTALARLAADK